MSSPSPASAARETLAGSGGDLIGPDDPTYDESRAALRLPACSRSTQGALSDDCLSRWTFLSTRHGLVRSSRDIPARWGNSAESHRREIVPR